MISRSAVMAAGAFLVLAACTGAVPVGTPSPQPTPTLQAPFTPAPVLPTPTAAPSTPAPTPSPTAELTPLPSPSPQPSPSAGTGFVELFVDDMSDPASGWGTGQTQGGTASYLDETLDLTPSQEGAYVWSRRQVEGSWSAMRLAGSLLPSPEATGYLGLLCGGENDDLFGAVLSTEGGWIFARLRDGAVEVLSSDLEAGLEVGQAEPIAFGLDCIVQAAGTVALDLVVNGQEVASQEVPDGPAVLDRVAAYGESAQGPFVARFDDVSLIASQSPDGLPPRTSQAALVLLQHVPETYRSGCTENVLDGNQAGAIASLTCVLPEGSQVELAEYVQFDSAETMNAVYQERVDIYGEGEDQSCEQGPAEGAYTIGGEDAGRLMCAEDFIGARFDWTDDRLDILSTLTDFEADFAALYAEWLEAGPNR